LDVILWMGIPLLLPFFLIRCARFVLDYFEMRMFLVLNIVHVFMAFRILLLR
jgi:hypothetical protein